MWGGEDVEREAADQEGTEAARMLAGALAELDLPADADFSAELASARTSAEKDAATVCALEQRLTGAAARAAEIVRIAVVHFDDAVLDPDRTAFDLDHLPVVDGDRIADHGCLVV